MVVRLLYRLFEMIDVSRKPGRCLLALVIVCWSFWAGFGSEVFGFIAMVLVAGLLVWVLNGVAYVAAVLEDGWPEGEEYSHNA